MTSFAIVTEPPRRRPNRARDPLMAHTPDPRAGPCRLFGKALESRAQAEGLVARDGAVRALCDAVDALLGSTGANKPGNDVAACEAYEDELARLLAGHFARIAPQEVCMLVSALPSLRGAFSSDCGHSDEFLARAALAFWTIEAMASLQEATFRLGRADERLHRALRAGSAEQMMAAQRERIEATMALMQLPPTVPASWRNQVSRLVDQVVAQPGYAPVEP